MNHFRNICHLELANSLTKLYLKFGRSRMYLILQGIRFQVQVLNLSKSVQESSEEVLDVKAQQLVSIEV